MSRNAHDDRVESVSEEFPSYITTEFETEIMKQRNGHGGLTVRTSEYQNIGKEKFLFCYTDVEYDHRNNLTTSKTYNRGGGLVSQSRTVGENGSTRTTETEETIKEYNSHGGRTVRTSVHENSGGENLLSSYWDIEYDERNSPRTCKRYNKDGGLIYKSRTVGVDDTDGRTETEETIEECNSHGGRTVRSSVYQNRGVEKLLLKCSDIEYDDRNIPRTWKTYNQDGGLISRRTKTEETIQEGNSHGGRTVRTSEYQNNGRENILLSQVSHTKMSANPETILHDDPSLSHKNLILKLYIDYIGPLYTSFYAKFVSLPLDIQSVCTILIHCEQCF